MMHIEPFKRLKLLAKKRCPGLVEDLGYGTTTKPHAVKT